MSLLESVEDWDGEATNSMTTICCVLAFLLTKVVCKVMEVLGDSWGSSWITGLGMSPLKCRALHRVGKDH